MPTVCEACGLGIESTRHILQEREKTCAVWPLSGNIFDTQGAWYLEFMDLVWYLIFVQHVGNDILEMLLMIAWRMWFNRNVIRHCHSRQSTEEVVQLAQFLLNEFQTANHTISQAKDNSDDPWTLPLASNYKVNVDGVVFAQSQQAGVRLVIRDHVGRVTTTLSKIVHQPLGPLGKIGRAHV